MGIIIIPTSPEWGENSVTSSKVPGKELKLREENLALTRGDVVLPVPPSARPVKGPCGCELAGSGHLLPPPHSREDGPTVPPTLLPFSYHLLGARLCISSAPILPLLSVCPHPATPPSCSFTPVPTPPSSGGTSFPVTSQAPRVVHTQLHRVVHSLHAPLHTAAQFLPQLHSQGSRSPRALAYTALFTHTQPPPLLTTASTLPPVSHTWGLTQARPRTPTLQSCILAAHALTRAHIL